MSQSAITVTPPNPTPPTNFFDHDRAGPAECAGADLGRRRHPGRNR